MNYMASSPTVTEKPVVRAPVQEIKRSELPMNVPGYFKIDRNTSFPEVPDGIKGDVQAWRVQINHDETHMVSLHLAKPGQKNIPEGVSLGRAELVRLNERGDGLAHVDTQGDAVDAVEGSLPISDKFVHKLMHEYNPTGGELEENFLFELIAKGASESFSNGRETYNEDVVDWRAQEGISELKLAQMRTEASLVTNGKPKATLIAFIKSRLGI